MDGKNVGAITDAILTAAILGSMNANKKTEEKKEEVSEYRKEAHQLGNKLYAAYLGFQDAGFTPEQAFELTLAMRD